MASSGNSKKQLKLPPEQKSSKKISSGSFLETEDEGS
jgi:hypothetical protein